MTYLPHRWPPGRRCLLLCLLPFLGVGCAPEAPSRAAAAAKIITTTPVRRSIVEWDEYVGRIDPIEEVEVRARVSGHLESTHFVEGQIVQRGDLLCILDQRPFRLAVEQAEADLARAVARCEEANAQQLQAEAEVQSAESKRELSILMLGRAKRLVAKNARSRKRNSTSAKPTSNRPARIAMSRRLESPWPRRRS